MNTALRLLKTLYKPSHARAYSKLPQELVVFTDDHMVVCWHPEPPFPYEFSRPIPEKEEIISESPLKIGQAEIKAVFHHPPKAELVPHELAKLTYTTKHKWYPRARDKKAKKTTPARPYL